MNGNKNGSISGETFLLCKVETLIFWITFSNLNGQTRSFLLSSSDFVERRHRSPTKNVDDIKSFTKWKFITWFCYQTKPEENKFRTVIYCIGLLLWLSGLLWFSSHMMQFWLWSSHVPQRHIKQHESDICDYFKGILKHSIAKKESWNLICGAQ